MPVRLGFKNESRNIEEGQKRRTQRGWNIDKNKLILLKRQYGFVSDESDESPSGDRSKLDGYSS